MAKIVIKDLTESVDLDRQAMAAISGGARLRGRQAVSGRSILRSTRIVNYPGGFATGPLTGARERPAGKKA